MKLTLIVRTIAGAVGLGIAIPLVSVGQVQKVKKPDKSSSSSSGKSSSSSSNKSSSSSSNKSSSSSSNKSSSSSSNKSSSSSSNKSSSSGSSKREFNSPTLKALQNSQTGQANGKGAPSSSKEYDNAAKKDK